MSEQQLPHFLFVCDHGKGDPARYPEGLEQVTWYRWWPGRGPGGFWWPTADDTAVTLTPLEGDRRGWRIERQMTGYQLQPDDEPMRVHHEIACRKQGCTRPAHRSDDEKLQTLLRVIATDQRFRSHFPLSADDEVIVLTLDGLRAARDAAKTRCGLPV
jgi:hypothetical protein